MFHGQEVETIPGFLLWQLAKLWQRQLELAFRELALSHTQAILLANIVRLTEEQKKVTQIMLSEATKVDPMTTSQVIQTLERKKLIKRSLSQDDKRAYYVLPTRKGKACAYTIVTIVPTVQKSFFNPLENDIETFTIILQKLIEANKTRPS